MARIRPVTSLRAGNSSVSGSSFREHSGSGILVPSSSSLAGEGDVSSQGGGSPEGDFAFRVALPGTVWYHNFESADEVAAFRWGNGTGNDPDDLDAPNTLRWVPDDGFDGGGCMERIRPVGTSEAYPDWWRPFSPFRAKNGSSLGNGRDTDDPAANGTIALQTWTPTQGGSQTENYPDIGFYGHKDYHAGNPTAFDGNEYWFQVRLKVDPNRGAVENNFNGGKIFYFTLTDHSASQQEIVSNVVVNDGTGVHYGGDAYFQMYRSVSPPLYGDSPGAGVHGHQPGVEGGAIGDGLCRLDDNGGRLANCWALPLGEWVTLLYHVMPGHDGEGDTLVQVFAAQEGDTEYRRIWHQTGVNLPFSDSFPPGHNALICSGFHNSRDVGIEFYHRWTQLIFSKQFVPIPGASAHPLVAAAMALDPGESVTDFGGESAVSGLTGNASSGVLGSIQWVNRFYYDHIHGTAILMGKYAESQGSPLGARHTALYNQATNQWESSDGFFLGGSGENGHVYEFSAYDPLTQTLYAKRGLGDNNNVYAWTRGNDLEDFSIATTAPFDLAVDTIDIPPPIAWSDNLFGAGDGGLVVARWTGNGEGDAKVTVWRRATDTWSDIASGTSNTASPTGQRSNGMAVWCRGGGYSIVTYAFGDTFLIPDGSAGSAGTPVQITNPPVECRYVGATASCGVLLDDPLGIGDVYILEKRGSNRVWRYNRAADTWDLQDFTHPATLSGGEVWTVASVYPYGVFWFIYNTGKSYLWRPNA